MEPTPVHVFSLVPFAAQARTWYAWQCSCGARSDGHFRWKDRARLTWHRLHAHRAVAHAEPTHAATPEENGFGSWEWSCTCGDFGRPQGYVSFNRARQSHSRHAVQATLRWYAMHEERLATLAERAEAEADRWARLSPEGRARLVARELEDLL